MDSELDSIKDSDYINVLQDIRDVVHRADATPARAKRGVRNNHVSDQEKAKGNFKEDMRRLLTRIRFDPVYGNMEQRLRWSSGMFTQSSY
ncbi:hypothetical protein FQN53_002001 [Emmonsiellopsis sp. PD_33]|nr:hypothetical protein FQN53_002001 [Emmonsiellopsis sp. PD_33]KAK2806149.1 hypothetical protein FQN51_008103 [Onygenales sp. PD_10]